jgi:rifampicin phosphotransferase
VIVPFDSDEAKETAIAGGKGSTLARLRAAGFPVPDGFVVTSPDVQPAELAARFAVLQARVGSDARFAVRSSGVAEDSAGASFAGQYETVLGVRGVDEVSNAIARCFASFSSARATAYQRGIGVQDLGGVVVVQRLVEAEAAGVAFTIDPITGARDRVVIDLSLGLGDAVVGGRVTPDGFVVMKHTGEMVSRRIVGPRASLGDEAVRAVAQLAERVERHEGYPVDIEWAWFDGEPYLLQARPVTAARGRSSAALSAPPEGWSPGLNSRIDPRFPLYSSGNVGEILPGCVTPLTYSLFSRGVEKAFRDLAESVGCMEDVGPAPVVVGFFYHRVYLNASYFMAMADNSPGSSRDTVYEDLIGPPPSRHPAWTAADLLPWRLWRGLRIVGRFLALQKRLDADVEACRQSYRAQRRRFDLADPSQWSNDDLASWIDMNDASLEPGIVHVRASQFAVSSFTSLRNFTRRSLGDTNGALAASLVTGIGSLASANPALGLDALARRASSDPALLALFQEESDDDRLTARLFGVDDGAAARLGAEIRGFIDRFGHRGFREMEFRSPCWRERPAAIVAHIRGNLEPGRLSGEALTERQQRVSVEARARATAGLPRWKRAVFTSMLDSTRKHIAAREQMKDLAVRFIDLTRRVIAAVTVRLANVLDEPDDLYFLLDREVAAALDGRLSHDAVADIVRRRRQDFDWSARVEVPKVQDGEVRILARAVLDPSAEDLVGLAVSPGVTEGRARVVLDPTDVTLIEGEILVAPVTDVAWTPLFLRAGGLVVDVGGPLSHGSIVAREYGIPAVTAVTGATGQIRSGDLVRVDGDRGVVSIVSRT